MRTTAVHFGCLDELKKSLRLSNWHDTCTHTGFLSTVFAAATNEEVMAAVAICVFAAENQSMQVPELIPKETGMTRTPHACVYVKCAVYVFMRGMLSYALPTHLVLCKLQLKRFVRTHGGIRENGLAQ